MAYRGIFFDLYGTLLVFGDMHAAWADWLSALHRCLADCGLRMERQRLAVHCDGFFSRPDPPPCAGLSIFERRIRVLSAELGLELGPRQICRTAECCVQAWQSYVTLDPDALPVLRALQRTTTLALVSNYDHPPFARRLLSLLGLDRLFEAIVISGEVGIRKPDPAIFRLALDATRLDPGEVAYVGDTSDDMQGARAAGMHPILIYRNSRNPSHVLHDFHPDGQLVAIHTHAKPCAPRCIAALPELVTMR